MFFAYFGPSRRSDYRVVEIRLDFDSAELPELPQQATDARQLLIDAGFLTEDTGYFDEPCLDDRMGWYSSLLAQTALLFQTRNDHRVEFFSVSSKPDKNQCIVLVQHEDSKVGVEAVRLAIEVFSGKLKSLVDAYKSFSKLAQDSLLPLETESIIKCARRRNIPFLQAEREPLSGRLATGFRVRPNGLLILGHGRSSRILDGTFCADLANDYLKAMLRNPDQRRALLKQLGVPTAQAGPGSSADSRQYVLLVINKQVTAIEQLDDGSKQMVGDVHESHLDMCKAVSQQVSFAPVAINLQALNLSRSLAHTGGVVNDIDLAPDLGQLLEGSEDQSELLNKAANDLLDWLFPDPDASRMPIIAVTGTNGKTTTIRMINHIVQSSGRKPGLVCTDGIFLNGRQLTNTDASSFLGHTRVLGSKTVDFAVLEAHHRGIAVRGFAFYNCNIAVCLNVTDEHLQKGEIESVEEMARIKCALLERASDAAVLFADDSNCLAMLEFIKADTICLVSLQLNIESLRELCRSKSASYCVLETIEGTDWIVLFAHHQRIPVMPVTDIPATFKGTARFNVSNAMHAIAASYLSGISVSKIRSALNIFSADKEFTPGRMNVINDLAFQVIIDFAHNSDGMQKVSEFIDLQTVTGRKVIAFAGSSKRTDATNTKCAQAVAGHFDFYFCKDYDPVAPPRQRYMASFMQQALIKEGVPEEHTAVLIFGRDVIYNILDACKPGDLLLILLGHVEMKTVPGYIKDYAAR